MRKLIVVALLWSWVAFGQQSDLPPSARGTYRISGTVVSAITGEPVPGTRLALAPTAGARWAKTTLAGRDGRFAFDRLPAGKLQLYAERAGYPRQGFDQHDGGYLSAIVTGEGLDTEHLVFKLQPASVIQGVIMDEFNEPIRGAQVMILRRGLRDGVFGTYAEQQDQSDDRGNYRFGSLLSGKYLIAVSARPWYARNQGVQPEQAGREIEGYREQARALDIAYPITFYSGATTQDDATEIVLRTGQTVNANVGLRSVPAIRVQIPMKRGEERDVQLSQRIFDFQFPAQPMTEMMPDGQGRVIAGIAPGSYEVGVSVLRPTPDGQGFYMNGRRRRTTQTMDLLSNTSMDVEALGTESAASVNGLARAEGVTLKNAFVMLKSQETRIPLGGRIDENGKFTIEDVPPGTYEVSIANSSSVYLANMAASGGAKVNGRTLEIPNGGTVQLAILLSRGIGEIKGTVTNGEKGFAGAMVVLVPEDPRAHSSLFRRDQSDSDGTFTLSQVVPGKYMLLAIRDGWEIEWSDLKTLKRYFPGGVAVQVEPNGKYNLKVGMQRK